MTQLLVQSKPRLTYQVIPHRLHQLSNRACPPQVFQHLQLQLVALVKLIPFVVIVISISMVTGHVGQLEVMKNDVWNFVSWMK